MVDNLLPDDIQFSSKLLLQYSLKSAFLVSFCRLKVAHRYLLCILVQYNSKKKVSKTLSANNQSIDATHTENDGVNADVDFWADQTAQDFGADDMMMDDFGDDMPISNFDDDTGLDQSK